MVRFLVPKYYYYETSTDMEREMEGLSIMPSDLLLEDVIDSSLYTEKTTLMADSEVHIPVVKVKVPTREQHELAGQALAAQRDIMNAIENLCNKLDDEEIHEYYL
jgi:hypothetical protein